MTASVDIRLLGSFRLQQSDTEGTSLPVKAQALAAFLVFQEGRPVKREVVSELLWPGRSEQQSRNSLKQELYILQRDGFAGLKIVDSRDDALALPPAHITCDIHRLRKLLAEAQETEWRMVAETYTGPLLRGFPAISPEFDDLLAGLRRTLEADVLNLMAQWADVAATAGETGRCIEISEWMRTIDPLREDTHRRLINAYVHAGRRADALRIYIEVKELLRREMDIEPAEETETLVANIRDAALHSQSHATVPAVAGTSGPPRIAVLPLWQSPDQPVPSHLSDGITADIISQLAHLRELTVIAHGSTFGLRDPSLDIKEIRRRLNVCHLVTGRIRQSGDRLRLTTELVETETSRLVYSHTETVGATLSFEDQDRIVARLVNRLVPQVHEAELRRIRGKRPNVLSIYDKVLLARERIMQLSRASFQDAHELLNDIVREDPGYAEAHALAADWHGLMVGEGWSTNRVADLAAVERLSKHALKLDSSNLRALVSYAWRRSINYRDHSNAMRMFDQALDTAPSLAIAWALSGLCQAFAGNAVDAIRRASWALELSPYDRECYKFYHALCVSYYTSGDYEQAAEWGKRALAESTVWRGTRGFTSAALAALGRLRESRELVAQIRAAAPNRRIGAVLDDLPYQDPTRRRQYGEHLFAAGFPE